MSLALKIYHSLPIPARSVAASLRGFYLRSWRYGDETELLIEEAIERESWNESKWKEWREERLARLLNRAAIRVPYYREQWATRRKRGDKASWEYLENWNMLDKEPLRANPHLFVADDCDVRRMFHDHTSGTTGKSLDLWFSAEAVRFWYALFEARGRLWYGVSRHDRWAILGGQLVSPQKQRKPPFWVWNAALNQLYMSSYHLAQDLIQHYLDALKSYRIKYLLGYTSALFELAQYALRAGQKIEMTVAITNAEPVFDYQRKTIEEAFQCPLRETFGMAETVVAASECEHQAMHLWNEAGFIETSPNNGAASEIISTGLINFDMPLIRYRTGDKGLLSKTNSICACGRTLPIFDSIDGRVDDVLYTKDGRAIGRLDPVFKSHLPILEAQIVQEELNRIRVRYIPDVEFTPTAGNSIVENLRERMGDVEVILESVAQIPRTTNGKFRAVICNLSKEQKKQLRINNAG